MMLYLWMSPSQSHVHVYDCIGDSMSLDACQSSCDCIVMQWTGLLLLLLLCICAGVWTCFMLLKGTAYHTAYHVLVEFDKRTVPLHVFCAAWPHSQDTVQQAFWQCCWHLWQFCKNCDNPTDICGYSVRTVTILLILRQFCKSCDNPTDIEAIL